MGKTASLEDAFDKIDEIINSLENGDVSLEDSFKLYNEGMKLVKNCNSQLDKVEKQIVVLNEGESNE